MGIKVFKNNKSHINDSKFLNEIAEQDSIIFPDLNDPDSKQVTTMDAALVKIHKDRPDVFDPSFDAYFLDDIKLNQSNNIKVYDNNENKKSLAKRLLQWMLKL